MALRERGEEWKEYDSAVRWMMITFFICLGLTILLFIFALPLSHLIGHGVSKESFADVNKFMSIILSKPSHLFTMYGKWIKQIIRYKGDFSLSLLFLKYCHHNKTAQVPLYQFHQNMIYLDYQQVQ